jgi:uncharacterized membrane protein YfcA
MSPVRNAWLSQIGDDDLVRVACGGHSAVREAGQADAVDYSRRVHAVFVFAAACVAGAINSVAGGGTLVTFPTLIWLGLAENAANATSTAALWPGALGSVWGYRREIERVDRRLYALIVPSVAGGVIGAVLLQLTPNDTFKHLVPFLILFATVLFMAQDAVQRRFNLTAAHEARSHWLSWTMLFQLGVAIYGGYFGAGIGILMLAALSLMGHSDIHRMNAVKNLLAACINSLAGLYFLFFSDLVVRSDALVMAIGAIVGGVAGAGVARRLGRQSVRRIVIAIGFLAAADQMRRLWF